MEHRPCATAATASLAEPAATAATEEPAVPAAVVVPGRAAAVVWGRRAVAALVAVVATAAPAGMRATSPTAQLVVMPGAVVKVERADLLARWAPTLRRCLAVLAGPAATPGPVVRALPVPMVRTPQRRELMVKPAATAGMAATAATAGVAARVVRPPVVLRALPVTAGTAGTAAARARRVTAVMVRPGMPTHRMVVMAVPVATPATRG